jgi:DNA-binding CsgD family transcriptional regulator
VSPGAAAAVPGPEAGTPVPHDPPVPAPGRNTAVNGHQHVQAVPDATLSAREQEIARRVLTGLTYKEIGAQLFISAKTVEHHMARIRRRLGAQSRRELFGQLRAMLAAEYAQD